MSGLVLVLGAAGCGGPDADPGGSAAAPPSGSVASSSSPVPGPGGPPAATGEVTVTRHRYGDPATTDPAQNYGDLFLPPGDHAPGSLPVVVFLHGGSWAEGVGADSVAGQVRSLAEGGVAVWNVEYRRLGTGGGWPTTFADVAAAVDHAPALGRDHPALDVRKVLVAGHSAGGQLAAWVAARPMLDDDEVGARPAVEPFGVVPINGVLDMGDSAHARRGGSIRILGGQLDQVPERFFTVDPVGLTDYPADAIVVQGGRDTMVPPAQADQYVRTVNSLSHGGQAALLVLPEADHVSPMVAQWPQVRERILRFAREGFEAAAEGLPMPREEEPPAPGGDQPPAPPPGDGPPAPPPGGGPPAPSGDGP